MSPTLQPSSSSRRRSRYPGFSPPGGAVILATSLSLLANELVIESFDRNGQLVFNEIPRARRYRVEWASTPLGPWSQFGGTAGARLDDIAATGSGSVTSAVPMLYRVVATVAPANPAFPLKKSANSRCLVDQNDRPFFINGDTPWSLIGQVSREDASFYLDDCAAKGINSLIITLVESHYADHAPANFYGVPPFTTPGKFTTPNEAYFTHADWVIRQAAERGMLVILAPNYLGCCNDGYWDELNTQNSESDARWFGEWLGNRYQAFRNLMYVWVNDANPCGVNSPDQDCPMKRKIAAMAAGVKAADTNHLHTIHPSPENSALDHFSTVTPYHGFTVDLNVTYTYQPVQNRVLLDYNRTPTVPFFLFESHYERDWNNAPPIQVRRQAYVALLSGAAGHHYGNNPIWHMNGRPGDNSNTWKQHLDDEARADLPHVRALFESREWTALVPDQDHSVVTAGFGAGQDYVGAARTADGGTVIAYVPSPKQITVDLRRIAGEEAKAWWFNPRDGSAQLIGTFPTTGSQAFTPAASGDWVLVLDNASLDLPPPGGSLGVRPRRTDGR